MQQRFSVSAFTTAVAVATVVAVGAQQPAGTGGQQPSGTTSHQPTTGGQQGSTADEKPASGAQAAKGGAVTAADRDFARDAAQGGLAEVELGQLAQKNGSAEVKKVGERIASDHQKANSELKRIAQQKNIELPATLAPKHQQLKNELSKLDGAEFDTRYLAEMVKEHQADIDKFEAYSKKGSDAELKAFAQKTLPTLREHMKLTHREMMPAAAQPK